MTEEAVAAVAVRPAALLFPGNRSNRERNEQLRRRGNFGDRPERRKSFTEITASPATPGREPRFTETGETQLWVNIKFGECDRTDTFAIPP